MNRESQSFEDASALSGLDSDADGRMFGLLDYDRDGWQDLVLVNANSPQLEIYQNQLGLRAPSRKSIAFRLIGGSRSAEPNKEWSNRNAFGAIVTVQAGGKIYKRELRCGEGFATQNSSTLHIGLGDHDSIDSAEVRWPSGKTLTLKDLSPGTLVTVHEGGKHSSQPFESFSPTEVPPRETGVKIRLPKVPNDKPSVLVMMATWCPSCKLALPQVALLKEQFGDDFHFIGIPVDPDDTEEMLAKYAKATKPAYRILSSLASESREQMSEVSAKLLGKEVLPSTLILGRNGEVIRAEAGVPTVSTLSRILRQKTD